MDQNGVSSSTSATKKKQSRHMFIIRTLQWLLPFTFASFLVSMTSTFSVCFNHYFHYCFSTLVFPILTHALERKYMFLICNGILAFLVKTLNRDSNSSSYSSPSSSSSPVLDVDENNDSAPIINPSSEEEKEKEEEAAGADQSSDQEHPADEVEEAILAAENDEGRVRGLSMVRSTEEVMIDDDEEEDMDEGEIVEELMIGGEGEKEERLVNMNTEELNQKFEEFIRKMKEELRIQETQKLIAAV